MEHRIRLATPADADALLAIYAPYVQNTAVSFEAVVPTVAEFARRIESIGQQYPYLLYQVGDTVVGYAYAARHRERVAYCYNVEISIYVSDAWHGTGVAHRLYSALFALLTRLGYSNAYAAYTSDNEKSGRFHEKFDFRLIGIFRRTGYKLGAWHDVTWLEKTLNPHADNPPPLIAISDLPAADLHALLAIDA